MKSTIFSPKTHFRQIIEFIFYEDEKPPKLNLIQLKKNVSPSFKLMNASNCLKMKVVFFLITGKFDTSSEESPSPHSSLTAV